MIKLNPDIVDVEGISNESIKFQFFIYFNEKKTVESFSIFYKDENNKVYGNHVFEDGSQKIEILN